jgi:hypothetical protein
MWICTDAPVGRVTLEVMIHPVPQSLSALFIVEFRQSLLDLAEGEHAHEERQLILFPDPRHDRFEGLFLDRSGKNLRIDQLPHRSIPCGQKSHLREQVAIEAVVSGRG